MLDTLYKFGRQLSLNADREEFDDQIAVPPIDEKEKAKGIQFYVARVIFDLDNGTFRLDEQPKEFSETDKAFALSPYNLRCIKIQPGNNKSIYPTADPRKSFDPWKKTLFGKEDKDGNPPKHSELVEAIQKEFPNLMDSLLCKAMEQVFKMRDAFETAYPGWKKMAEGLKMDEKNRVAMLYASVVSTKLGILQPTPVTQLEGYDEFLRRKFLQKGATQSVSREKTAAQPKLCYVTGELGDDISEPVFDNRYSLNKMFVTTTKNYATGFDDKNFSKNYQAGSEAQVFLERGSAHFLKNYKVSIAGINHCIVPQFRAERDIDLDNLTTNLKKKSELLFLMTQKQIEGMLLDLQDNADDGTYWINFLGFESDGNFFKTTNLITDVSKTHFEKVLGVLDNVDTEMSETEGIQWDKVMTYGKDQSPYNFNFYTIYNLIPVRDSKRNEALILFKAILERRPVIRGKLFEHFAELVKCHWFQRKSADNIKPVDKKNFDFAVRNAVFQYHAFLQFLKKIKLLDMAEKTSQAWTADLLEKEAAITDFFSKMNYSPSQSAMFYLGRALSKVAIAQYKAKHKQKPVLNKVNYNGMDKDSIQRLQGELFDKCRQYAILTKETEGYFTNFFASFQYDGWKMKPEEALFFLLSGYSFRTSKETTEDPEDLNNPPEI